MESTPSPRSLGLKVLNLSKDELVEMPDPRLKGFGMARTWLEADAFVTLPVLKTHATTVFTGALKNQWGCIPRYDRILLHKHLHELIGQVNAIRPVTLALMDGLVGMQGRGPINGYPINLNVLLASRDPVALDATAMRLIGLEPSDEPARRACRNDRSGDHGRVQDRVDGPFADLQTNGRAGGRGLGDQADESSCAVAVSDQAFSAQRRDVLSRATHR